MRGHFVGWLFTLLVTDALWYSWAAFLARCLSALAALLFLIYPGFLDQPNAFDYQSHQWSLVFALWSIFCTLRAFQPGARRPARLLWLALSMALQAFALLLMEYYIGLEGLRLLLVWQATTGALANQRLPHLRQALLHDLPNLLVALAFFACRAFIFNSQGVGTDVDAMLLDVAESPALRLLWMVVYQLKDLLNTLCLAWTEPLYHLVFTMRLKNILLALLMGAGAALVFTGVWLSLPAARLRIWLPAALTAIAVAVHTANTLSYADKWKVMRDFWRQVS